MVDVPSNIRVDNYRHDVLHPKETDRTCYLRYWGAIGDFYYFLTFVTPLLRQRRDWKIVLAADAYPRYGGDPLREICKAHGMINELWVHDRCGGGPTTMPPEFIQQFLNPRPEIELYTPGIYYDGYLVRDPPSVVPFPLEMMRGEMKMEKKYLIPIPSREVVAGQFNLPVRYMTVQPDTVWKKRRNVLPLEMIRTVSELGTRVVVLRFPNDRNYKRFPLFNALHAMPNVQIVDVDGPIQSLSVQAHAVAHFGVESSQILGAGIYDVPTVFLAFGGYVMFQNDLALDKVWRALEWGTPPEKVISAVQHALR